MKKFLLCLLVVVLACTLVLVAACDETENAEFEEYRKIVTAMAQKVNEDWGTSQNVKSGKLYRQHPAEEIDAIVEQCTEKRRVTIPCFSRTLLTKASTFPWLWGKLSHRISGELLQRRNHHCRPQRACDDCFRRHKKDKLCVPP